MIMKTGLRFPLFWIFIFSFSISHSLGLKIIKQYPESILSEAMPWQIDTDKNWTFIATEEGLLQSAGFYPELFPLNNRRPVRSVSVDRDRQRIFVGGISEFGYFKPSVTKSLEYVCLSDSVGEDKNLGNIWGIYEKEGIVYVQGDVAVLKYDMNSGDHTIINSQYKLDTSHWINDILWLGTDDGLKLLLGNNIIDAPSTEPLKGKRLREILPYKQGYIIVTSDSIWYYEGQKLRRLNLLDEAIRNLGEIFSADIRGEVLALGSVANGVGLVDINTGDLRLYDEERGLPSNTVISLKFDDSGDLWTGLQYGMAKIMLNQPIERIDNAALPIGSGYVMTEKAGKLYMGTNRGVYVVPVEDYKKRLGTSYDYIEGLQGQVWGLVTLDGDLLCSHDKGLFIIKDNNSIERIGDISGVWDVQRITGVPNKAYVGTYSGLYLIEKGKDGWKIKTQIDGFGDSMYNFVQESPVVIWSSDAERGIVRLTLDTVNNRFSDIRYFKSADDGNLLTADVNVSRIDNDIYFSTPKGIYIYDKKNEEIKKEKQISTLLDNPLPIKRLKKTNGSLFALTEKELLQADPAGILDMKRISLEPSLARPMHEKELFFPVGTDYIGYPTRNGYLFFDYSDNENSFWDNDLSSVRIDFVTIINKRDSVIYRGNFAGIKEEPVLNHNENSIRIIYGNPEDLKKGILFSSHINNEPWSEPSPIISKELTDLKGGKYRFEVKAIAPDGKISQDFFTFRVNPPWWRSNWMMILYAVILISIIFVLIRLEQLRVSRKQRRIVLEKETEMALQKAHFEREKEEKDRHIEALERDQFEKELKHKAQEVANVMMSLSHKNETLLTVKKELQNILTLVPRGNSNARKAISGLQEKVVVDIKSDDVLRRVEDEFDLIHDNFMKKLRIKYHNLSNNEILLCAYLKMNLSTKEIAPLLNISQRGVETMRYRLRKKLNLEREDSLSNFIANFG